MNYQSLSLKLKITMVLIPVLILMVVFGMITINWITKHSLDLSLKSSLESMGNIAAGSVRTGLEFEDEESISDAVKPFIEDKQIAFLAVMNGSNQELFSYRKEGYPSVSATNEESWKKLNNEIFVNNPVQSGNDKIGSVVLSMTLDAREEALAFSFRVLLILTVVGLTLLTIIIIYLVGKITNPITYIADVAKDISKGDLDRQVEIEGEDEIGQLGESFRQLIAYIRNIAKAADALSSGDLSEQIAVQSDRDVLAKSFRNLSKNLNKIFSEISQYAGDLNSASEDMNVASEGMSAEASTLSEKTSVVASATEQMNGAITTISSNAEEMTTTVDEIAQNAEKARVITNEAVMNTQEITKVMGTLDLAASEISNVIQVIFDIADQTKLLALNATIEAARAGEAGKGFAVVANEVKELAAQTNSATDEIRDKINAMQASTKQVVDKADQINKITTDVNEIVVTIATAVEEQSVTTRDIAQNISQTSLGAQSISQDMAAFSNSSANVNDASSKINRSASGLMNISKNLKTIVDDFKF